jgi:transcriptional regulator with XRE-family HTH domain
MTGPQMAAKRRQRGLTQAEVASAIGVSRSYLALMETGHRPVSRRTELAFLHLMGRDPPARTTLPDAPTPP